MRLRPQFQLRFRSADQFIEIRGLAESYGVSMNEWLLERIESNAKETKKEGTGRPLETSGSYVRSEDVLPGRGITAVGTFDKSTNKGNGKLSGVEQRESDGQDEGIAGVDLSGLRGFVEHLKKTSSSASSRPAHDPKSCRVYGCLQCEAEK